MSEITFSNVKKQYRPGDVIDTQVVLDVTKEVKLREFRVKFKGQEWARVDHTETYYHNGESHTRTVTYYCKQPIVKEKRVLMGDEPVVPGRYEYNVQFQIPTNALPSFPGKRANIVYELSARANVKLGRDVRKETGVTVIAPLPTENPATPIIHTSKYYDPSAKKPGMQIKIDDNTVPRGESITGKILITPGSKGKKLRGVDIRFYRITIGQARGYTYKETKTVFKKAIEFEKKKYQPEIPIDLPISTDLYPTFYGHCVTHQYQIEFNLDVAWGFDRNLEAEIVVM